MTHCIRRQLFGQGLASHKGLAFASVEQVADSLGHSSGPLG